MLGRAAGSMQQLAASLIVASDADCTLHCNAVLILLIRFLAAAGMPPETLVVAARATKAVWLDAVPDAIVLAAAPRPLHFMLQVCRPSKCFNQIECHSR